MDEILNSLDETDATLDSLWAHEAEERLAAWRRGDIRVVPLDEALRQFHRA